MRHAKTVAVIAGFLFITLAIFVQGFLPAMLPQSREKRVTMAVRTHLGEIKWVQHEATDYTELEKLGRRVYIREGCWYCHSQYVRPVTGEDQRWGPVSQAGEYAFDIPHLFSTRRIGPDLSRVGLKYSDGWHYAHHWDPRMLTPDSNMPAFPWLFYDPIRVAVKREGDTLSLDTDNPQLRKMFTFNPDKEIHLTPNEEGLAFTKETDGTPVLFFGNMSTDYFKKDFVDILIPRQDLRGLIAYIQKLGMNRGNWRDTFEPQRVFATEFEVPESEEWIARGREVYQMRCQGCHGVKGDGNGPAATFFSGEFRPRDFTSATFKFRTTPSGSLPTNGDLLRTITVGVRGTAMPTWHELTEKDRLAVIQYIKTFSEFWKEETPLPPIEIPKPPPASPEMIAQGKEAFESAKCWQCHGRGGKGDGPSANELKDDWGFPIRPADFTRGLFKSGPGVRDIFRTMSTGLNGTPMPSYIDTLSEEQRWQISYYVLSFSAYRDPLHNKEYDIPEAVKTALDSPDVQAPDSKHAFNPATLKKTMAATVEDQLKAAKE